jgi:hypothetical protein
VSAQPDDLAPGWQALAACRGRTPLFFAADRMSTAIALRICMTCPVRAECEAEARRLELPWARYGVVAGYTAAQRNGWR